MTINKNQFRFLVGLEIIFGVASVIAAELGQSSLPIELQDYLTKYYESSISFSEWLIVGIAIVALVSNIGIFFFANWSRNLFTVSYLLSSVSMVFDKALVQTNIETALVELSIFCAGFIVACMYLTDIKNDFIK